MADEFIERVLKHRQLKLLVERRDVVFRHEYENTSRKMPFQISRFPAKLSSIYEKLEAGELSQDDALEAITTVMEGYYEMAYPLSQMPPPKTL